MTTAGSQTCDKCLGCGKTVALYCGENINSELRETPCEFCQGTGLVDADRLAARAEGDAYRLGRLNRRATLLDEANRYGCTVVELSAYERGVGPRPSGMPS